MTTTEELRAEIEKTRVEMHRLYVRTIKLLGGFMAGFMVIGLGGFTVIYKFLGCRGDYSFVGRKGTPECYNSLMGG